MNCCITAAAAAFRTTAPPKCRLHAPAASAAWQDACLAGPSPEKKDGTIFPTTKFVIGEHLSFLLLGLLLPSSTSDLGFRVRL